jgi:hypothetical protein
MITIYVTYAGDADTRFAGFFPHGDGAGPIAVAACVFRDKAAMEAALASAETERVMADVGIVTDVNPQRSLAVPL